ncbi:response regulator transcription factor [Dactylosporangium sp. CA-139066]|uniref:response regulator transcription factor n=1 Tax=Dactylosporangium sp. CA-139066 TaxID=3239930 RepID=UPI003D8EA40E
MSAVSLFEHALRVHRQDLDAPLPDHASHEPGRFPVAPDHRREGADVAAILDAYFARPDAEPSDLTDAFHDVYVPVHRNAHIDAAALRADRARVRDTGRWLVRRSADRCSVTVGLALLANDSDRSDIPLIQTIGLLAELFGPPAAEALSRRRTGNRALEWLAERTGGWGRVYYVEMLCRHYGMSSRDWLLRNACDGDHLNGYFAFDVATAAHLHAAILAPDPDDDLVDHAGRLLAVMTFCRGMGGTLEDYPPAPAVLAAHAAHLARQAPTARRAHRRRHRGAPGEGPGAGDGAAVRRGARPPRLARSGRGRRRAGRGVTGAGNIAAVVRVLVVEDDEPIADSLRRVLAYEGYDVAVALDGPGALSAVDANEPDVVVLDRMLPGLDGIAVCRRLRSRPAGGPLILMLTARDATADRVAGLDAGADDYLVKPFDYDELLARIRALLRRRQPETSQTAEFDDLVVDLRAHEVRRGGRPIELTAQEFALLRYFLEHPRQVFTRAQLRAAVWGMDFDSASNVVDVYVGYLRAKLGDPRLLHTVRGVGYVLRRS